MIQKVNILFNLDSPGTRSCWRKLTDADHVQIFLKALGPQYAQLSGWTSAAPERKTYAELVASLKEIFGPTKSLFRRRHDILMTRLPPGRLNEEIVNHANLRGDEFSFGGLTLDAFKIFLMLLFCSDPYKKYSRFYSEGCRR